MHGYELFFNVEFKNMSFVHDLLRIQENLQFMQDR